MKHEYVLKNAQTTYNKVQMIDISRQYLYLKNRRIVVLRSKSFEMMKSGSVQQSTSYLKCKLTDHKIFFVLIVLTRGIMLHNK